MAAEPLFASADPSTDDPFGTPLAARFCILHSPAGGTPTRGVVVHVHPFAEEMNKSRRMAALQARALAAVGFSVLQFDLLGCGDSAGDFGDATWSRWLDDVLWAVGLLRRRVGGTPPLWLWGHRVGALLAAQAATLLMHRESLAAHLFFWQPVASGRAALQQFLRLKAAAQMLDGGGKGVTEGLKRDLAAGHSVEVAGYRIHPELAQGLEAATLEPPQVAARLVWLELASGVAEASLLPATRAVLPQWQAAGWQVDALALPGPAFWQTVEIEEAATLAEHGTRLLLRGPP
jgi:exosortase A-associated hydrolase 2